MIIEIPPQPDLVLIGCVKTQREGRHQAQDLYASALFAGRRARAESSGAPWLILSAKYGIVDPHEELDEYNVPLKRLPKAERLEWARTVLRQFDERFPHSRGMTVEIHSGVEYRAPLDTELARRGVSLVAPLAELGIGRQLSSYKLHYGLLTLEAQDLNSRAS